jgi:hypothetical protein
MTSFAQQALTLVSQVETVRAGILREALPVGGMPWAAVELGSDSSGEDPGHATLGLWGRGEACLGIHRAGNAPPAIPSRDASCSRPNSQVSQGVRAASAGQKTHCLARAFFGAPT